MSSTVNGHCNTVISIFSIWHLTFINWLVIIVINHQLHCVDTYGCSTPRHEPICCQGKQSNCYVYMRHGINSPNLNHTNNYYQPQQHQPYYQSQQYNYLAKYQFKKIGRQRCFCDENCLITKDCCPNYYKMCSNSRVDCKVSKWGPWSQCNKTCGTGLKTRRRKILVQSKRGGLSCPVLTETKTCIGRRCPSRRVGRSGTLVAPYIYEIRNEVAHLLPVRGDILNLTRRYDMRWDVRRKLYMGRLIKMNKTEDPEPEPYCATYEITQSNQACQTHNLLWQYKSNNKRLDINSYFRQRRSTFKFSRNPYLTSRLINRAEQLNHFNDWDKTGLDAKSWITHASLLVPGQQICVTCYSFYMRKDLGYRCAGSGLPDLETRWRALRTSDCQGRFRMINMPRRSCTCGRGVASFVFV